MLINLVGNAIKYSPQGGLVIITLGEETASRMIRISVQGHGIDIPQHQHAQIFWHFT